MMDSADEESQQKRQKSCDVIAADRLSDLPESILLHILSLLPLKSVVATSCLSKSWSRRWLEVTTSFDFHSGWWSDRRDFVKYFNTVMDRNSSSPVPKFSLRWENWEYYQGGDHCLNKWLEASLCRSVRVVDLGVFSQEEGCHHNFLYGMKVPSRLITRKTLEILKLRGPFIIKVPPEVEICLPKLVHLELNFVHFQLEEECLRKLMRGCPVLKSFRLERKHHFKSLSVITWSISSPSLKHLEMYLHNDGDGYIFRRCIQRHYKLEIDAPALEKLVLMDQVSEQISIRGGSIEEAELDIRCDDHQTGRDYQDSIVQLIQGLGHVKTVKLSERTMDVLSRGTNKWSRRSFQGLTKLV